MKYYFLYILLSMFSGNPVIALAVILVVYAIIDKRYIGLLPDFSKSLRRWQKMAALKRQIASSPALGRAYYELGALQVENGDLAEGRRNLAKAHGLMPEHPDLEYYLGVASIRTGALDEGKEILESALKINPKIKYAFPYVYLIEYNLKKGEAAEQIEAYVEKVREYGNPEIFYELGMVFLREGHKAEAREMFREAQAALKDSPAFMRKQYRYFALKAMIRNMWI